MQTINQYSRTGVVLMACSNYESCRSPQPNLRIPAKMFRGGKIAPEFAGLETEEFFISPDKVNPDPFCSRNCWARFCS